VVTKKQGFIRVFIGVKIKINPVSIDQEGIYFKTTTGDESLGAALCHDRSSNS